MVVCDELSDPHNLGRSSAPRVRRRPRHHHPQAPLRRASPPSWPRLRRGRWPTSRWPGCPTCPPSSKSLEEEGLWVFGAEADGTTRLYDADLKGPAAIVIGSEGAGMGRLVAECCDFKVSIPMRASSIPSTPPPRPPSCSTRRSASGWADIKRQRKSDMSKDRDDELNSSPEFFPGGDPGRVRRRRQRDDAPSAGGPDLPGRRPGMRLRLRTWCLFPACAPRTRLRKRRRQRGEEARRRSFPCLRRRGSPKAPSPKRSWSFLRTRRCPSGGHRASEAESGCIRREDV